MNEEQTKDGRNSIFAFIAIAFEVTLIIFVLSMFSDSAIAGIAQNVTVITQLEVGNSAPEVLNVSIEGGNSFDLIANSTRNLTVYAVLRDYNGDVDINVSNLTIFDSVASSYGGASDNNNHYTNSSCIVDTNFGDSSDANVTCTVYLWYYANNATWNVSIYAKDTSGLSSVNSVRLTINTLLALGLPDSIDYGIVNSTYISDERIINITNFGNVLTNFSVSGYAVNPGDGLAMNCSLGAVKNISVYYEKYNLTSSNDSILTLSQFESIYSNLSSSATIKRFNLNYRQNEAFNEAENSTYWRMYVPIGVAGNCSGNIVFGAIRSAGN